MISTSWFRTSLPLTPKPVNVVAQAQASVASTSTSTTSTTNVVRAVVDIIVGGVTEHADHADVDVNQHDHDKSPGNDEDHDADLGDWCPVRCIQNHAVADVDHAWSNYLGAEPAPMQQSRSHSGPGDRLKLLTRLTQTLAFEHDLADTELTSDEMIERYALGHDVSPCLTRVESNIVLVGDGSDRFCLDQSDVATRSFVR